MTQSIDLTPNVDTFLQELAAIQQVGPKRVAILGSRHVPIAHQYLIETLSFALALTGNRILTSGATGTNLAVVKGAIRADVKAVTVILPQSLDKQPAESRASLEQVMHLVEHPENDQMPLAEASQRCNEEIISKCQQLICFAFHDSETLLGACQYAEDQHKLVTLFYFD